MKKVSSKKVSKKSRPRVIDVHTNDDVKRYIGAVSEDFKHQVSAVAEQFGGLNNKIDSMRGVLDSHTEMIGNMSEDIEIIKSNIEIIKSDLNKKVDYSDFSALEKRVRLVETKLHR